MTIEFLVACHDASGTGIKQTLIELLVGVLEDNQNEIDEDAVDGMIVFRHRRSSSDAIGNINRTLLGFAVELPDDTQSAENVIREFTKSLSETQSIIHVLKFEDPLLKEHLAERAAEIFAVEMKLRRVLSMIYLYGRPDKDFYDVLDDERVSPMVEPTREQMETASENPFFHLTFDQYIQLNQRRPFERADIFRLIQESNTYEELQADILKTGTIYDTDDMELLADLQSLVKPIEDMRNAVAHNRRPTNNMRRNYPNALENLNDRLDQYLDSLKSA